jgi:hypothetical protein
MVVRWVSVDDRETESTLPEWYSWLQSSGAVRIDGDAERAIIAEEVGVRIATDLAANVCKVTKLTNHVAALEAEVSRLLEAMRGIEGEAMSANCEPLDMYAALSRVGGMAREAIKREEEGKGT